MCLIYILKKYKYTFRYTYLLLKKCINNQYRFVYDCIITHHTKNCYKCFCYIYYYYILLSSMVTLQLQCYTTKII